MQATDFRIYPSIVNYVSGLSTKVNLVAHLNREINDGFRDIFAPKNPESKKESENTKEGHKNLLSMHRI